MHESTRGEQSVKGYQKIVAEKPQSRACCESDNALAGLELDRLSTGRYRELFEERGGLTEEMERNLCA